MKLKLITISALLVLAGCSAQPASSAPSPLPVPELEEGLRGEQFGIDKNINEKTIDQYLNREDTVYRDMRMLKDEAEYEAIGGDSWLSGYVEGFEIVPFPYLTNVEGLPPEVGTGYRGDTLFIHTENGYEPAYEESMEILEYLFPKDKNIILMCGGGGYAGMTKGMLAELGWDASKIYNAGGYWFYEGEHSVSLKREENGETYYDFYKAPYHYIDFSSLHRIQDAPESTAVPETGEETSVIPAVTAEEISRKAEDKETFAVYISLPGCGSCAAFLPVISEYAEAGLVDVYGISLTELKETETLLSGQVEYTPSVAIIENGEVKAVLKADSDADLPHYQSVRSLSEWFNEHLGTEIIDGEATAEIEDCEDACTVEIQTEN